MKRPENRTMFLAIIRDVLPPIEWRDDVPPSHAEEPRQLNFARVRERAQPDNDHLPAA